MAHMWNSTDLRKPLSIAKPSIHSLNAVLELILDRRRCAASAPPIGLPLYYKYSFIAGKKSLMESTGGVPVPKVWEWAEPFLFPFPNVQKSFPLTPVMNYLTLMLLILLMN